MNNRHTLISPAPFVFIRPTVAHMSVITIAVIVPQLFALILAHDFRALATIVFCIAGASAAELLLLPVRNKMMINDGTAVLIGLLTAFFLPSGIPFVTALLVTFSGVVLCRTLFGGLGTNWINPVMFSVAIAYLTSPDAFPSFLVTAASVQSSGDAFAALRTDNFQQLAADQGLTASLNSWFFSHLGIKLPDGYMTLFLDSPSTIPAFRFNLLTLGASIILLAGDIIDKIVPAVFLFTYAICVRLFALVPFGAAVSSGDILFALLTGGILFTAFFILPDYATSPRTATGKVFSGILAGILAFLLCGPGGSPIGIVFTVLAVNAINPVLELIENRFNGSLIRGKKIKPEVL